MRVLISGGTGFIGTHLVKYLVHAEHEVTVICRDPSQALQGLPKGCAPVAWEQVTPEFVHSVEAIINLAGESVATHRWSNDRKNKILSSRVDTTRRLVECVNQRPENSNLTIFISASAVGFYGNRGDEVLSSDATLGTGFLAQVCEAWEAEAKKARGVRTVIPRIGMVLGADGGALRKMLPIFKLGLGGELGSGLQWMSWIHIEDLVRLFDFFLSEERAQGVFNAVAPFPVTNKEFTKDLASTLAASILFRTPAVMLKLAFGEMASLFLDSQRAVPKKTLGLGFQFRFPTLLKALDAILTNS